MIYLISTTPSIKHDKIAKSKLITDWFHYTDGVYLVISDADIEKIRKAIGKGVCFIIKLEKNNFKGMTGMLPNQAWDWISKNTGNKIKLKKPFSMHVTEAYLGIKPSLISRFIQSVYKIY